MNLIDLSKIAIVNEQNEELQKTLGHILKITLLKRLYLEKSDDEIDDDNLLAKYLIGACCSFENFANLDTCDVINLLDWVEDEVFVGGRFQ